MFSQAGRALLPDRKRTPLRRGAVSRTAAARRGGRASASTSRSSSRIPAMPPPPDDDGPAAKPRPEAPIGERGAAAEVSVASAGPRRRVPAAASPVRPDRALRRPDRSRQGLRGADRVLQQLREGGRRRDAGADGRQADGAAGGAVHPVRRPAVRQRAPAGARSGDRRRLPVAVREPVAARARSAVGRHAGPGQRAQRRARRALRPQQRRPVLRGPRRVRRVPEAAGRRRAPARGARPERPRLRAAELPLGRRARQIRADLREGQERART